MSVLRIGVCLLLASVLAACAGATATLTPSTGMVADARSASGAAKTEFIGFWESWSDANAQVAFARLSSVPAGVTTVDVAFSLADSNAIAKPQNAYPIGPGAKKIHARGGKVLLSFGGATSKFGITNPALFVANLKAFLKRNPGVYDGFDFDDERIQTRPDGRAQLIDTIEATRAAFPNAVISFDAVSSGADPHVDLPNYSGEDRLILQKAGNAIDYVNVMDYDQFGWKPTTHPNCSYATGAADDCYRDIVDEFANVPMPGGSTFPRSKIVMGLMIGEADDHAFLEPSATAADAQWVVDNGYRGVMIWDVDLDNPQAPMNGTGYPKGTYVDAIAGALGTT